jgi:NADP-dependent 3-hydroxy acid dehydrogenase YdfG
MLGGSLDPDNFIYCNLELDIFKPYNIKHKPNLQTFPTTMTSPTPPVWFITAASSGFGKYIAFEALNRGHKVIASARSVSRIADLKEAGADVIALDVTSPLPEIEKVAKEANAKYGYITHLVNAAGYILEGAVEETS